MADSLLRCESRLDRVVVHARGAVVTRLVTLPAGLPEGAFELVVSGITGLAEAGSLRASIDGDRELLSIEAKVALPAGEAASGELRERVRTLDLEAQALEDEEDSLCRRRDELRGLSLDPQLSRGARRANPADRFADALALGKLVTESLERLDERRAEVVRKREENQRAREAAAIEAAQADARALEGERKATLEAHLSFAAGAGQLHEVSIDYVVGAARWWPAYSARFSAAATQVHLSLDAFVAQASGEDWTRVKLGVSTADLAQDVRLPELPSLHFGRAQPPPKKGYRPAPAGLEAMFEGYDRALVALAPPPPMPPPARKPVADLAEEEVEGVASLMQTRGFGAPPSQSLGGAYPGGLAPGLAMPMGSFGVPAPSAAPMAAPSFGPPAGGGGAPSFEPEMKKSKAAFRARASAPTPRKEAAAAYDELDAGEGGGHGGEPAPVAVEPADEWLDFDALALADPAKSPGSRGRLVRAPSPGGGERARAARAAIHALAGPPLAIDPLADRGRFDHRYDAAGTADVPSSGVSHRVSLAAAEAAATPWFVAVPREAAEVYREVDIKNPFEAPLLGGPVDIFLDGALMTTSPLAFVDRGGSIRLGLGVEDRLRVARNVYVGEGSAGLLGGTTTLDHTVNLEVSSSLGRAVSVEVLDRLPVSDEKDVEVKTVFMRPEAERYSQVERGAPLRRGLRWRIDVAPGESRRIELCYRVTLPAKNELVGGNRRES